MSRSAPQGDERLHRLRQAARKRSAREWPTAWLRQYRSCERCNAPLGLYPRHHPDIDRAPARVQFLCDRCHERADRELGKRGSGYATRLPRLQGYDRVRNVKRPEPMPPVLVPSPDRSRAPLVVLVGAPCVGKTMICTHIELDYSRVSYDELEDQTEEGTAENLATWLDMGGSRPTLVEHVGISRPFHAAIVEHVTSTRRPATICCLYVRETELIRRLLLRFMSETAQQRAIRIAGLLAWLYPAGKGVSVISAMPPPMLTADVIAQYLAPMSDHDRR
jgi:hypothetical protein